MRTLFTFLVLFTFFYEAFPQCNLDYSNFNLNNPVFEEEFNYSTTQDLRNDLENRWQFHLCPNIYAGKGYEYYDKNQVKLATPGVLRLQADLVYTPAQPVQGSTRDVRWKSGLLQTKRPTNPDGNCGGQWPHGLATYGLYEMRAKIPSGNVNYDDVWPTFWLYNGPTEIDMMDAITEAPHQEYLSGLIDWVKEPHVNPGEWEITDYPGGEVPQWYSDFSYEPGDIVSLTKGDEVLYYLATTFVKPAAFSALSTKLLGDLQTTFHTYSMVWTPDKVTFFFDGRELYSIDPDVVATHGHAPEVIISLQMHKYTGTDAIESAYMDIDFIRMYEFDNNDPSLSYKSESDFMNTNIHEIAGSNNFPNIRSAHKSLAHNSTNLDEVFFVGTDYRLYKTITTPNDEWGIEKIDYNYAVPMPAAQVVGELNYHPIKKYIIYKGGDNRLQYFAYSNSGGNYYHLWLDDDWSNWPNISPVSSTPGSVAISPNGYVVYKGADQRIHIYYSSNGDWHHIMPSHTYSFNSNPLQGPVYSDYVEGDVLCDANNNIIYKGADGRVQIFVYNGGFSYSHHHIDNDFTSFDKLVHGEPGSICLSENEGILYRSQSDNSLQRFLPSTNSPFYQTHEIINHNYGNTVFPNADRLLGNLEWDDFNKRVIYRGHDGRLQCFSKTNSSWQHWWYDDYWNTDEYLADNSSLTFPSTITDGFGRIFYRSKDGYLKYFEYTSCEVLNPPTNSNNRYFTNINRFAYLGEGKSEIESALLNPKVYPNPILESDLNILFDIPQKKTVRYIVYNLFGEGVLEGSLRGNGGIVNCKDLSGGYYTIKFLTERSTISRSFIRL